MNPVELKWDTPLINGHDGFFSEESFSRYSMLHSLPAMWHFKERELSANNLQNQDKSQAKKETAKQVNPKKSPKKSPKKGKKGQNDDKLNSPQRPEPKIRYNRLSIMTAQEQKIYLDMCVKYASKQPSDPKEKQKFKDLCSKVNLEQNQFLHYLRTVVADKCIDDYNFIHPEARAYMEDHFEEQRKRVMSYPKYYVQHDTVSLIRPKVIKDIPFVHQQTLLKMGDIPKVILPNIDGKSKVCLPCSKEKIRFAFPVTPMSSKTVKLQKQVISEDPNVETLAKKYDVAIAISSSGLQCLIDNHPPYFKQWEVPVTIKEYETKTGSFTTTHKVVYIDKPFVPKSVNVKERNDWFHKFAFKAKVQHPKHMNTLRINRTNTSEEADDTKTEDVNNTDVVEDDLFGGGIDELETFGTSSSTFSLKMFEKSKKDLNKSTSTTEPVPTTETTAAAQDLTFAQTNENESNDSSKESDFVETNVPKIVSEPEVTSDEPIENESNDVNIKTSEIEMGDQSNPKNIEEPDSKSPVVCETSPVAEDIKNDVPECETSTCAVTEYKTAHSEESINQSENDLNISTDEIFENMGVADAEEISDKSSFLETENNIGNVPQLDGLFDEVQKCSSNFNEDRSTLMQVDGIGDSSEDDSLIIDMGSADEGNVMQLRSKTQPAEKSEEKVKTYGKPVTRRTRSSAVGSEEAADKIIEKQSVPTSSDDAPERGPSTRGRRSSIAKAEEKPTSRRCLRRSAQNEDNEPKAEETIEVPVTRRSLRRNTHSEDSESVNTESIDLPNRRSRRLSSQNEDTESIISMDTDETAVLRRTGRNTINTEVETVKEPEVPAKRKRGRPPKQKNTVESIVLTGAKVAIIEDTSNDTVTDDEPTKPRTRRTRSATAVEVENLATEIGSSTRRASKGNTAAPDVEPPAVPVTRKRGRKKKSENTETSDKDYSENEDVASEDDDDDFILSPHHRKKLRVKAKNLISDDEEEDNMANNDLGMKNDAGDNSNAESAGQAENTLTYVWTPLDDLKAEEKAKETKKVAKKAPSASSAVFSNRMAVIKKGIKKSNSVYIDGSSKQPGSDIREEDSSPEKELLHNSKKRVARVKTKAEIEETLQSQKTKAELEETPQNQNLCSPSIVKSPVTHENSSNDSSKSEEKRHFKSIKVAEEVGNSTAITSAPPMTSFNLDQVFREQEELLSHPTPYYQWGVPTPLADDQVGPEGPNDIGDGKSGAFTQVKAKDHLQSASSESSKPMIVPVPGIKPLHGPPHHLHPAGQQVLQHPMPGPPHLMAGAPVDPTIQNSAIANPMGGDFNTDFFVDAMEKKKHGKAEVCDQSGDGKDSSWESVEKADDYVQPIMGKNVAYDLWELGEFKMLVRTGTHGVLRDSKKKKDQFIHLQPKVEYQPQYGVELVTPSEAARAWISLQVRPNCHLVRGRVSYKDHSLIMLEELSKEEVVPATANFHPMGAVNILYDMMDRLHRLPPGGYLLSHSPGNAHAQIKKQTTSKVGVYDLHLAYMSLNSKSAELIKPGQIPWVPIDISLQLPFQKKLNRIPATFEPKDSGYSIYVAKKYQINKNKKKKKKGKKGGQAKGNNGQSQNNSNQQ